jgi:hypothetical protein
VPDVILFEFEPAGVRQVIFHRNMDLNPWNSTQRR